VQFLLRKTHLTMQSANAMGPMLNIIALFSIISIFTGTFQPIIVLSAFLLSYLNIIAIYWLSRTFTSDGGYYTFAGKVFGPSAGTLTALLYALYGLPVLLDLSLFVESISEQVVGGFSVPYPIIAMFVGLMFIVLSIFIILTRERRSFAFTVAAGTFELTFIIITSMIFLIRGSDSISQTVSGFPGFSGTAQGLIFALLAFSGGGSSIFLSEKSRLPTNDPAKSIILSYTIVGLVLVLASFALNGAFTNGASSSSGTFQLISVVFADLGRRAALIFYLVALLSALNLTTSYLRALMGFFRRASIDNVMGMGTLANRKLAMSVYAAATFALYIAISLTTYTFLAFEIIAGLVSLSYIVVHIITNFSFLRLKVLKRSILYKTGSAASSVVLILVLIGSISGNLSSVPQIDFLFAIGIALCGAIIFVVRAIRPSSIRGLMVWALQDDLNDR